MKIDKSKSVYRESALARTEFNKTELKQLRFLFRRLQYLESRMAENEASSISTGSGAEVFIVWEVEALEFVLDEVGFLSPREEASA